MGGVHGRIPFKGIHPSEYLIEDHPKRENVGPSVHYLATDLLWGHIGDRSQGRALLGEFCCDLFLLTFNRSLPLGQPEVHHFHMPLRGEHVIGRFQIPMHDLLFVCCFQSLGNLRGFFEGFFYRKRAFD